MVLNKNIVLIGMMGSGKSTIGFLLSKKINLKFIDIDNYIENEEGMKIHEIFKKKGEKYFRIKEKEMCLQKLKDKNTVIALGGGAFIEPAIREVVLKTSVSFWLDLSIKNLSKRFKTLKKRPLIDENNLEESLNNIYQKRKGLYNLANFKIDCNETEKSLIIKKIAEIYESN